MCNISNRPLGVPADNLFKLTMEELLKERNAKMSQCIMLQNKNGVVMASDSALTEIDNNVFKLLTKIHPKVFSGPNFIWTFAGVVAFEKDIEKRMELHEVRKIAYSNANWVIFLRYIRKASS